MKQKDEAEKLVRKYYTFGLNNPAQSFSWYECKECALIAVDLLIENTPSMNIYPPNLQTKHTGVKEYWQEVKQEIEKI